MEKGHTRHHERRCADAPSVGVLGMKQQMFIRVDTVVDNDKNSSNDRYEPLVREAIKAAIKEVLGTPKKDTTVEFDYGDPV